MTMPVFVDGMHIDDNGELVIHADKAAESNYHGRMMNMPTNGFPPADLVKSYEYYPAALKDPVVALAYKYGHRDARHAAAEIANEADARIAELEAALVETIEDATDGAENQRGIL